MFGEMTWELCARADQSVLAELDERDAGAKVDGVRHAPRSAQLSMSADDPAVPEVLAGHTLLRVKVAGWPRPLFIGRVSAKDVTFDAETETVQVNALDPYAHLQRCPLFASENFPGVAYSYYGYTRADQSQVMWDQISRAAGYDHGIVSGDFAQGSAGPQSISNDTAVGGGVGWNSPGQGVTRDGLFAWVDLGSPGLGQQASPYLDFTDWHFDVPDWANIVGVVATVGRSSQISQFPDAYVLDNSVRLLLGGIAVGTDHASAAPWPGDNARPGPAYGDAPVGYAEYGGSFDLWGLSLSPDDVNGADFGIAISAQLVWPAAFGFGINQAGIDDVVLQVWYTDDDGRLFSNLQRIDVSFPAGSMVSENIGSVVSLANAPEFELKPLGPGANLVELNTYYPKQGRDKSGAFTLKIGVDDDDDVTDFSYSPSIDAMANAHTVIGDVVGTVNVGGLDWPLHLAARASHAASAAENGTWETVESASGLTSGALLAAAAYANVTANAYPIEAFSVTLDPDADIDFSPDGDIWMGDTIGLRAGLPHEDITLKGRITGFSLVEDEAGVVTVTLACSPDSTPGVSTPSLFYVVMDAADGQVPPPPPEPEAPPEADAPQKKKKKHKPKKKHKKKP